jgi:uncharacterized protein YecE (DUF72 family)
MDFGKLPLSTLAEVDFTLPADHPCTGATLSREVKSTKQAAPAVYVGCPVWSDKAWWGKIYPPSLKEKEALTVYTRQFNTIELNVTHYQIPTLETVQRWKQAAAPGFTFCPKFPQVISHDKQLLNAEALSQEFATHVLQLEKNLGTTFLQLGPTFAPKQGKSLLSYLDSLPAELPVAVEFRHSDWFADARVWQRTCEVLTQRNVATVITDVAGRRDVLHQTLTIPRLVLRFVGNELHPTDYTRSDAWLDRIAGWLNAGLQEAFIFIHCGTNHLAPELATYWIRGLNARCQLGLTEPAFLPKIEQTSLF